jgi:hypothetical protein
MTAWLSKALTGPRVASHPATFEKYGLPQRQHEFRL